MPDASTADFDRSFAAYAHEPPNFDSKPGTDDDALQVENPIVVPTTDEEYTTEEDGEYENDVSFESDTLPATVASARSAVLSAMSDDSPPTVRVALHEELAALYNDGGSDPVLAVSGTIHIESQQRNLDLILHDTAGAVGKVEPITSCATSDLDGSEEQQGIDHEVFLDTTTSSHRILRLNLPQEVDGPEENRSASILVARYGCTSLLKPVPLVRGRFARQCYFLLTLPFPLTSLSRHALFQLLPQYAWVSNYERIHITPAYYGK